MREYEPKYPLVDLDKFYYPNLLRDANNVVLSENVTFLVGMIDPNNVLKEIESNVRKECPNVEVAYNDSSGNRWVFLILNRNQNPPILRRMQAIYSKLYKKIGCAV